MKFIIIPTALLILSALCNCRKIIVESTRNKLEFTVDGKEIKIKGNNGPYYTGGFDTDSNSVMYGMISNSNSNKYSFLIGSVIHYESYKPSLSEVQKQIGTGSYSYTNYHFTSNQVVIDWIDEYGESWSTSRYPQPSSSFMDIYYVVITRIEWIRNYTVDETDEKYFQMKIKGDFSCSVWNELGQEKKLTNGKLKLSIVNRD